MHRQQGAASSSAEDGRRTGIGVAEVVRWIRYGWLPVLVCALLGGVAAWLHSSVFSTETYRASAIIAIVPPKFSSDLLPSTFTVQGYQELLESDAVLASAERRLIEAGDLGERGRLGRGQLRSTIFVSRRSETSLAPMIRLGVSANDPERAAAIVNTWAEVFLDRVEELVFGSTSATIEVIEELYPTTLERLEEIEDRRATAASEFDRRRAELEVESRNGMASARSVTARVLAEHEAETFGLVGRIRADKGVQSRQERLDALHEILRQLEREHAELDTRLSSKELEMEQLRRQLEKTDATVELKRSVPSDVILGAVADGEPAAGTLEQLKDLQLIYEIQSPVYNQLNSRLATVETDVNVLRPRAEKLSERIASLSAEITEIETGLAADESELTRVSKEREAALQGLIEGRATVEQGIEIRRDYDLAAVERERELRLLQLDRQIAQQRALYEQLADKYNEVLLARGQEGILNVRLAAPGVPPRRPVTRAKGGKVAIGIFLGALLGVAVASFRRLSADAGSG